MKVKLRYWWHGDAVNDRCACCEASFQYLGKDRTVNVEERTYLLARGKAMTQVQTAIRELPVFIAPPLPEIVDVT